MCYRSLLRVAFGPILVHCILAKVGFISFSGHVINGPSEKFTVTRQCECKNACYLDPECMMASALRVNEKIYECKTMNYRDTSIMREKENAVTFVMNRNPDCELPFDLVNGVGCIHIPNNWTVVSESHTLCLTDSALYSPATLAILENMRQHLIKLSGDGTMSHVRITIGLQKNSSGAFVWRTGGYIEGSDPAKPFDVQPGQYPFQAPDPNDANAIHAVMAKKVSYKMFDIYSTYSAHSACQMY